MSRQNSPQERVLIEIQLLPFEEEDLETLAAVGLVSDGLKQQAGLFKQYQLINVLPEKEAEGNKTRSDIEFFRMVIDSLQPTQATIALLIASGLTALRLLLKQRRVKKVEVKVGNKTMVIENADQNAVEKSLTQFEDLCKQEQENGSNDSNTIVALKAFVSKKNVLDKSKNDPLL